jgi:tRNA(Ile)-lysidine synthase
VADGTVTSLPGTALTAGFDAAMRRCLDGTAARNNPPHHLFTALSGGPDSTALACLAQDYATRHCLRHTALIVDHRIRGDSTAEAHRVAGRMRRLGVSVEVLAVSDDAPQTGLQAWARDRRYDLMLACVRRARGCLLLGQHADDQAETVLMRLSRGSGLAGLAAMAPVSWRAGVPILRPLLDMSPDSLIDHCASCDAGFEIDPSNLDRRFERVRVRGALAVMADQGSAMSDHLLRLARAAGTIDRVLLRALAGRGYLPAIQPSGHMLLPSGVAGLPTSIAARLLAHVIGQVARPQAPPATRALHHLAMRLADGRAATLGGVRFSFHDADWLVTAEIGRRPPRLRVRGGEQAIFAGIWEIASPVDAIIRHLGEAGSGAAGDWTETPGWCALPSLVRRSMPVLETLDGAVIYPHLQINYMSAGTTIHATARFLPMSPVAVAYRH